MSVMRLIFLMLLIFPGQSNLQIAHGFRSRL